MAEELLKMITSVPYETQKANIEGNKRIPKEIKEELLKSLELMHKKVKK